MSEIVTFELSGTIPTADFGNLEPKVVGQGQNNEEAREDALRQMEELWNRTCMPGRELKVAKQVANLVPAQTNSYEKVVCEVSGAEVLFDEAAHKYTDSEGRRYLSGSTFASRYKNKFEADLIGGRMAKKFDVPTEDILGMWSLNGNVSSSLGTAVHNALELYGKYLQLSLKTKGTNESALTKNELLRPVVESFFAGRENEDARYEMFVADKNHLLCGFIDRLVIVDAKNKVCRVQDFKTNASINKSETIKAPFNGVVPSTTLGSYWLQLSFYAFILKEAGWTVEGLDIFNYEDGKWKTYSTDVVDISSEIN